ncbi:hypothetical protein ACFE04_024329 [Oxalis oulophora]
MALLLMFVSVKSSNFTFNGFDRSYEFNKFISCEGYTYVNYEGILKLTSDDYHALSLGHAFYSEPISLKTLPNHSCISFSTTFVFAITRSSNIPHHYESYYLAQGHGLAFVIAPTYKLITYAFPAQYLGLFNSTNVGKPSNHIIAIELDIIESNQFGDMDNNHVGIDINDLRSIQAASAGYYDEKKSGRFKNLTLTSGYPMQVWIEYDGVNKQMNVTLAPLNIAKPSRPLLSLSYDISPIIQDVMYVGFSASTGGSIATHCILGWSFSTNTLKAPSLNYTALPQISLPQGKESSNLVLILVPTIVVACLVIVVLAIVVGLYFISRKNKFAEVLEDWEQEYGPHRFSYKHLYKATRGFDEKELLGKGGFGRVYKGVLPKSKVEVAVKKISHDSKQGMKEFIAEIISIGHLRHRNLVQFMGYCRREGELLLVYDYMPNGSLDKYLYNKPNVILNWRQRFHIIKGVASALLYLHEEWEQLVIHRDVKASNVLLDGVFNGKLGDFGLARLCDHGSDPITTHVAGTLGYIAPEQIGTGKATTRSDVFAFGVFLLEVACGRKPIDPRSDHPNLVNWVFSCWQNGDILVVKDQNLGINYVAEEVELVLKLGLLCSHVEPLVRPSMRQVVQYLEGDSLLSDLSSLEFSLNSQTTSTTRPSSSHTSIVESILSQGR